MKRTTLKLIPAIIFTLLLSFVFSGISAKHFKTRKSYQSFIYQKQSKVIKRFLRFNNAISEGETIRRRVRLRTKLLNEIHNSAKIIDSLSAFKNDSAHKDFIAFRDSSLSFMKIYYDISNDDYKSLIGIRNVAGRTFSEMKLTLLTKESVFKKSAYSNIALCIQSSEFMKMRSVKKDKLIALMEQEQSANNYFDSVYFIFLKNYLQESSMLAAIDAKDAHDVERQSDTLSKYAAEGLEQLDSAKTFRGDPSLLKNLKRSLKLYTKETDKKTNLITDYIFEAIDFKKTKATYDQKATHPADDVKSYKKSVKEFNKKLKKFNKTMAGIYKTRKRILSGWNFTSDTFFENHLPE